MAGWSQEETFSLIAIWGSDSVQEQLKGSKRNKSIFIRVAQELSAMGYSRTAEQCREKIKKMKAEYRKRKSNQEAFAGKEWKFLNAMDRVMSYETAGEDNVRLSPLPQLTIALENRSSRDEGACNRGEETPNEGHVPPRHSQQCPSSSGQTNTDDVDGNNTGTPTTTAATQKRRRECDQATRSNPIHLHQLNSPSLMAIETQLLVKLIELQNASEKRQLEFEEKRMRFEERMMERDDQRRREDRQFQLQMMSVIMGRSPVRLSVPLEPHNNSDTNED